MEQEKYKCKWCGEDLEFDDIFISKEGWAYCCKCETVLCDLTIQDKNHFLLKNIDKIPCSSEFKKKIKASIDK